MTANGDGYTIKDRIEILANTIAGQFEGIIKQLDAIDKKLDDKASNERVALLEKAHIDLELRLSERIKTLELGSAGAVAVSTYQKLWLGFAVTIIAGVISALIYVAFQGAH